MLFVVCAPGLSHVTAGEAKALGLPGRALPGGLEIEGGLSEAMRLNLWLRTASRVLLRIGEPFRATAFPELVRKAADIPWEHFVAKRAHVAFRVTCRKSRLYHSDAVAERLHAALEARVGASVPLAKAKGEDAPEDVQLFIARFERDLCAVSVDTSGALLHRRGWRGPQAKAPLRETLAAALLLAAAFRGDEPLCDPLCGSGTIAIEAALIAMQRAPGIGRRFAFQQWPEFSAPQWGRLLAEASRQEHPVGVRIEASDQDAGAVAAATQNAARAGVRIELAQRSLADLPPAGGTGLLACNAPYGVRVNVDPPRILQELVKAARHRASWRLALIATESADSLAPELGVAPIVRTQNGGIPVKMFVSGRHG